MLMYGPITLRSMEKRDMDFLRELLNSPDISSSVVEYGFPVSSVAQEDWYKHIYPGETGYRFIIETGGIIIGSIVFNKIDIDNKTGELGFKIACEYQGNNYAFFAVCAFSKYLFEEIGIECIVAYHIHTNIASRRVLEKSKFIYEGTRRSAIYKNGRRQDLIYWSCSREHFESIRKELQL